MFATRLTRFVVTLCRPLCGVAVVLAVCGSESALAQQQEDRPRLVLQTLGPAEKIRTVAFSADSARVFSAGFDKVVHMWDAGWNVQPGEDEADKVTPTATLRWEIARGNRGVINVMAASPKHHRVAVGGSSARDPYGDIILFDTGLNELEAALPAVRNPQDGLPGQRAAITTLDFSPSGERLLSVSYDGDVWVWTLEGEDWTSQQVRPPTGDAFSLQPAIMLDETTAVISERVQEGDDSRWRLAVYEIAPQVRRLRALPTVHEGRVQALARDVAGDRWASADERGHVYLWNGANAQQPRQLRFTDRVPTSLSFGPNDRLAITNRVDPRGQAVLELWNADSGQLVDQARLGEIEHLATAAISPDGVRLVTHDPEQDEIVLFRLIDENGNPFAKPLSGGDPPKRTRGRGRSVWRVAFPRKADDYTIGFGTNFDQRIYRTFNLKEPRLTQLAEASAEDDWRAFDDDARQWLLQVADDRKSFFLDFQGSERAQVTLNEAQQGTIVSYCFVPDANGNPIAVAIGTATENGIYIYSLPDAGETPQMLRYFRDHQGRVTSLSASADGKFLVSGSTDQTMKIWSLEGLADEDRQFSRAAAWGADFVIRNGQLTVVSPIEAGIGYGRKLREGDVITSIRTFNTAGQLVSADQPQQILELLEETPLYTIMQLTAQRDGNAVQVPLIVAGWEPLLTLFVDDRGEWALFTPAGYFESSVAEGGDLFGWQINRGRDQPPRFLKAAALQKEFEKPDVIRNMLVQGSTVEALQAAGEPVPADFQQNLAGVAGEVPEVRIVQPLASDVLAAGQPVTVRAEIVHPAGADPARFTPRGTIGGRWLGPPTAVQVNGNVQIIEWQGPAADQLNLINVTTEEQGPAVQSLFNSVQVFSRGTGGERKDYKLHVLALASTAYDGEHLSQLQYPIKDVESVVGSLLEKQGRGFYEMGTVTKLYNDEITPQRVEAEVKKIQEDLNPVGPQDLVLVYLAGHGLAFDGAYYYLPTSISGTDQKTVEAEAIPWKLLESLADFRCHVVWMLDTCKSGVIADLKAPVREIKRKSMMVVASTSQDNDAFESDSFRGGHGAFTASVLDGLDGQADGYLPEGSVASGDQQLTISELADYVTVAVYRATFRIQQPCYTPSELFAIHEINLLRLTPDEVDVRQ